MDFIKAEGLTFEYMKSDEEDNVTSFTALDKVSFSIKEGSFTAIIGQNGSGKSTLARNMNALLAPTGGTLLVDGLDASDENNIWEIRKSVAMVFQNPDNQLVSSIVEDDVAFGPENMGISSEQIRLRVDSALKEVGMYDLRKKAPHMLSGGQKQRVAIAGAVAAGPKCIVFDEPTAMLDPRGREDVMNIITRLNSEGLTTVLITHFMEEAARADHVIVLDQGHVAMEGSPAEVFKRAEELKRLDLDVPPAAALAARLRMKGLELPEEIIKTEELVDHLCQLK